MFARSFESYNKANDQCDTIDFNCQGMSYIHLSDGKFRPQLPTGVRQRCTVFSGKKVADGDVDNIDEKLAFLRNNTPEQSIWESEVMSNKGGEDESQTNNDNPPTKPTPAQNESVPVWAKKETSCDIEIDIHVSSIMNVNAVMKSLPEDKTESQNIHWRAVPSLREIWQEERRRMAKLLEHKDDFLSRQLPTKNSQKLGKRARVPPFTLSVKKNASTPGAKRAAEGMKRLLNITAGLETDFVCALHQIIQRHSVAVSKVDTLLKPTSMLQKSAVKTGTSIADGRNPRESTPSEGNALGALGGITSQFRHATDSTSEKAVHASDHATDSASAALSRLKIPHGSGRAADSNSKAASISKVLHAGDHATESSSAASSSLKIPDDRGHATGSNSKASVSIILHSSDHVTGSTGKAFSSTDVLHTTDSTDEPLSSSKVLHGNDVEKSEKDRTENQDNPFSEKGSAKNADTTSFEWSQRVDRGDSIVDGRFGGNVEDYIDPQTLTPFDDYDEEDDDEKLNEQEMEHMLSTLASQLHGTKAPATLLLPVESNEKDKTSIGSLQTPKIKNEDNRAFGPATRRASRGMSVNEAPEGKDNRPVGPANGSAPGSTRAREMLQGKKNQPPGPDIGATRNTRKLQSRKGRNLGPAPKGNRPLGCAKSAPKGMRKKPKEKIVKKNRRTPKHTWPPERGSLCKPPTIFLPLNKRNSCNAPGWLKHTANYESFGEKVSASFNLTAGGTGRGFYIEPAFPPPRRDVVAFWIRRRAKRAAKKSLLRAAKKRKTAVLRKVKQVDSNTGKVMAADTVETPSNERVKKKVRWHASVSQKLSVALESKVAANNPPPVISRPFTAASGEESQLHVKQGTGNLVPPSKDSPVGRLLNQGGRLVVEGGGQLKATTRPSQFRSTENGGKHCAGRYLPTPLTIMSIETHVQCRTGRAGVDDASPMALTPDPGRDKIYSVAYVYGKDPGGGGAIITQERGCYLVPLENADDSSESWENRIKSSMPHHAMGVAAPLSVETARDETQLLLRLASLVTRLDPDMLVSWDTQSAGIGYMVERGASLTLDMAVLLSRTRDSSVELGKEHAPLNQNESENGDKLREWAGSGLGAEWDDRVGAGQAAASIVSI